MADPPWPFSDRLPKGGKPGASTTETRRGAELHYKLMKMPELLAFVKNLPPLAPDCVLFLWRVASMQQEALDVLKAWGFKLKTEIVWRKTTKTGKRHFGMGRIVRAEHETCLIAVRGKPQVKSKSVRSVFDATGEGDAFEDWGMFEAPAGAHSAKPEAIYEIIEELYEGPYLSVFDRRTREGWTCQGDQVDLELPYAEGLDPRAPVRAKTRVNRFSRPANVRRAHGRLR